MRLILRNSSLYSISGLGSEKRSRRLAPHLAGPAIDAPELKQPFGKRSQQSLAQLCAAKAARVIEKGLDRYGRTVGWIVCDGVEANSEQVRRGMAWVFVRYAPSNSPLYGLQAEAQGTRRGLWVDPQPVAPWQWRIK